MIQGDNIYDPETGLWLATGDIEIEQWDDPAAALRFLRDEWLVDFPFASEHDFAGAVMVALGLLVTKTDLIDAAGPPLILITSQSAGSGKSLLADVINAAVTGSSAGCMSYPDDEEERGKVITSCVMSGSPIILFDNLKTGTQLGNSHAKLSALVTATTWEGRILGVSQNYRGPAGLTVLMTANNAVAVDDMASRTIEIRLTPRSNVAERRYRHASLLRWTKENRGRLLGAFVAILAADRSGVEIWGRFHEWSRVVATPVLALLGIDDFFERWVEAGEHDLEGKSARGLDDLLGAIARLRKSGGSGQAPAGDWLTAQELLNSPGVRGCTLLVSREISSPQALTSLLQKSRGNTVRVFCDDAVVRSFRLHAERRDLGARTGRKTRWVFRVETLSESGPVGELVRMRRAVGKGGGYAAE